MIKPFPSDRIGRESMKKRKAESCVWKFKDGFYHPSCVTRAYHYLVVFCGNCSKRVRVKR